MPNYVKNELKCKCSAKRFKELCEAVATEETEFSFQRIIPRPEALDIEAGSRGDYGYGYYCDYIQAIADITDEQKKATIKARFKAECDANDADWELGHLYYENLRNYGAKTWYDWSYANWGTKWDACDAYVDEREQTFNFDTAWSAPIPVIQKLVTMFPDIGFTLTYADEDIGNNCGEITFFKGQPDKVREKSFANEKEAVAFACDIWGYDPDEYFD